MIDLTPAVQLGVLLVRPGMLVMLAPALGGLYTPPQAKIALMVFIAIALLPSTALPQAANDHGLALVVAREVAIGLSLALVTRALVAAAEFAGHLSGFQIGFSYAATVDPIGGARNNVLAAFYGLLAVLAFLAINGHHAVLRALAESYARLPVGTGEIDESIVGAVKQVLALVFSVGVRLAAPVVIAGLVVELAVGLISRTAPALSMMVVGFPLRIVVGLAVLALIIGTVLRVVASQLPRVIELALGTAAAFR